MIKKFQLTALVMMLSLMTVLTGCGENNVNNNSTAESSTTDSDTVETQEEQTVEAVEKEELTEGNIKDNKFLYEMHETDDSMITMYLTVSSGNEADGSNHTWAEVNTYSADYYRDLGVDRYKVEGILQIDEGDGVTSDSFGYEQDVPNVSVQVRGQTSSRSDIKNYKIRIKDGKGSFRGQRTLDLNKHLGDPYRFTNKLCYEMLEDVPQLLGGRTQFVNLFVKDTTEGGDGEYHDYGLYTIVEQVNKTYLKNRGLDEKGQLYKVTFFEWNEYEAVSTPVDSPDFDRAAFERYLEIKGDMDTSKLNHVVEEIGNYMRPIDDIVESHFDAENICYWMAYNILIGNYDSGARNLFLYSPLNSEKFYMICWDMDASLRRGYMDSKNYPEGLSWERGMSQYLGLTLINRMLKEEKYRDMLTDAVNDLYHNYVTPARVRELVEDYREIAIPFLYDGGADSENAKISRELYDELTDQLDDLVENNYNYYMESVNYPWPFFVAVPEMADDEMIINWDISYDVNGEEVVYNYVIARDYDFSDVVAEGENIIVPSVSMEPLEPGTYYIRVQSTNESGYTQDCFDYYSVKGRGKVYACSCFVVNEDGTIVSSAN